MVIKIDFDAWISRIGICVDLIYKMYFLTRGLRLVYRRNSIKFLVDLWVLEILSIVCPLGQVGFSFFKRAVI